MFIEQADQNTKLTRAVQIPHQEKEDMSHQGQSRHPREIKTCAAGQDSLSTKATLVQTSQAILL